MNPDDLVLGNDHSSSKEEYSNVNYEKENKTENNDILLEQESETSHPESHQVHDGAEKGEAETSLQNKLLTGEENNLEGEIIVLDIVSPTLKKNIKNKKRILFDWEKKKENTYVTMEEINIQEDKVKKLKTLVNYFSAPGDSKELQLDNMIDMIRRGN